MPYLIRCGREAHERGIPVMRAMMLEFPEDPACAYLDRQYMLGPDVLAAPVFTPSGEAEYWLPAGTWVHLLDGRRETGGKWMRETCGFLTMPLWKREA